MRYILSLLVLFISGYNAFAENVSFVANAPNVVAVGEQFQLKYEVSVMPDAFSEPSIKGFDILAGPNMSRYQSTSIVNGKVTSTLSITYTYILEGNKEGKFTISGASVKVGGRNYTAKPIVIEVVRSGDSQSSSKSSSKVASSTGSSKGDIFLRMEVNKSNLYRGEFLVATLKLYTRVNIQGLGEPKFPSFNGFWNQVVEDNDLRLNFVREKYNGKIYETAVIRRYVLFPQQIGKLVVDPFQLVASVVERSTPQSAFDAFFGGGSTLQRKRLSSAPITITAKELPSGAPKSYDGAIGNFTISSQLSKNKVRANDAVTLTVKIAGTGNVKLIENPKIDFPADFETFEPKISDNVKTTAQGASGTKMFEYSFIPRSEGKYTIPGLEFSYFDTRTGSYKTLTTPPHTIEVAPDPTGGAGSSFAGSNSERIKMLNKDINYIRLDNTTLHPKSIHFFGSTAYMLFLLLIISSLIGAYLFLQKREKENSDIGFVRNKRANKAALQRLKKAEAMMKSGDVQGFYDEILTALWGYLSDKLLISIAHLSKENITNLLREKDVDEPIIEKLMRIIEDCEFARYAPAGELDEKEGHYNQAIEVISELEQIKRKKK